MPPRRFLIVLWAILLVCLHAGTVASMALLVDYSSVVPRFCAPDAGCEELRRTSYSHLGPIPTPVLGLIAFATLAVLLIFRGERARIMQAVFSAGMAAVAAFLILFQFQVHHFCPYCMVVDSASLIAFAVNALRYVQEWDVLEPPLFRFGAVGGVALAGVVTASAGFFRTPQRRPMPPVIAEELARTPPGKTTVVDFVDFECPHCRHTHAEMLPLLKAHEAELRVVRKQVPLSRLHPHALTAALAACCGEQMGKGDAMADALMATPVADLTTEGCEKIAVSLGLDVEAYRACIVSPATDEHIKKDGETFKAVKSLGLPTIWIGNVELEGSQDRKDLERVFDAVLRKQT